MYIDIKDIAFWMDAIRNSENHYSVLESFWKGQLKSKEWLIENLHRFIDPTKQTGHEIVIHGGWNGVLASMLFNSGIAIDNIVNVDIDENTIQPATDICKRQEIENRFVHIIQDMEHFQYNTIPDIVINTSTEHLTKEKYHSWLNQVPQASLIVLQNNNYKSLPEHVNCYDTADDFANHCGLRKILYVRSLDLPLYDRFLVIGYK